MVGTKSKSSFEASSVGQAFRARRLELHLSVQQVAQALGMPRFQIEALERGDFSVFAAEVYARGACGKYAKYLGVDDQISERVIWRALTQVRETVPLQLHTTLTFFQRLAHPHVFIGLAIAGVAFVVGGYIVWQVQSFFRLPDLLLAQEIPAVVHGDVLEVAGSTDPDTRVSINGESVLISPEAKFTTTLVLHPGINVVRVEAENAASRVRVLEQHVLYSL